MFNIYQTQSAKIISVDFESVDTKLLRLKFLDRTRQREFDFLPGQFVQIGLPGWGECPISLASSSTQAKNYFELAIRGVGKLTNRLLELEKGDLVEVRGPYGNGFDVDLFKDKPLLLIGGGCGFVPLRPLINDYLAGQMSNTVLQIFYGCQNEENLLFKKEYHLWNRRAELNVILEKPSSKWAVKKA